MDGFCGTYRCATAILAAVIGLVGHAGTVCGQAAGVVSSGRFELSDAVQLDRVDNTVLAQWERAKALLADRQWDEAVEILRQLAESSDGKLLEAADHRYVTLRDWCQRRLAVLPPEALKLYRARVDPVARQWYEQGIAQRNPRLLRNVVEQAFASRYGDDALLALGDIAFESGDFAQARWCWERILPVAKAPPAAAPPAASAETVHRGSPSVSWPGYPDTDIDPAAVRARLVAASILEGPPARAKAELAEFARLHPDARGRLGGRDGKYADLLAALLAQQNETGGPFVQQSDWPTFAGNPQRNRIAVPLVDVGSPVWRHRLRSATESSDHPAPPKTVGEDRREPLSFHPVVVGHTVLVNDSEQVLALRLDSGQPAWGRAAIYQSQLAGVLSPSLPSDMLGSPRYTMTVFRQRLFARMGSPMTGEPSSTATAVRPGCLVCLDLTAEGRLVWKVEPDEGFAFEGTPVADSHGVYVALRRHDIRPQAFVACLSPETGRERWRRFICSAETPARGVLCESTHNLLTLDGDTLYYNTNLGAVAAVRTDDGWPLWVSLYPRARRGHLAKLSPHWRRDLNPCVLDHGRLLVAPADSPRIFAFDSATGQMLWQTGVEVEDAVDLLGAADPWLIAGGGKLYWISMREEDRGRVKHVWPDGPDHPGYGRGVLAGESVLWSTRDRLYVFDRRTAAPLKTIDLAARGAGGGNLFVVDRRLLIATADELIAIGTLGGRPDQESGSPKEPAN